MRALSIFSSYFPITLFSMHFSVSFSSHSLFGYACSTNISSSWISFEVIMYMGSYEST